MAVVLSPESRYCFGCGSSGCVHARVTVTYVFLDGPAPNEKDDPALVDDMLDRIDDLRSLEPDYGDVPYWQQEGDSCDDEVNSFCEDIFGLLRGPDNIVHLFVEPLRTCDDIGENEMYGSPDEEWFDEVDAVLGDASVEAMREATDTSWGRWPSVVRTRMSCVMP